MSTTILSQIANKLSTLNSTYLTSIPDNASSTTPVAVASAMLGNGTKLISGQNYFTGTDLDAAGINRIFTNVTTADSTLGTSSYNVNTSVNVSVFNVNSSGIGSASKVAATGSSFSTSSYNLTNASNPITTDINCIELLLTHGNGNTAISKQMFFLQALYAWYSLFDAVNWKIYNSGQSVTFNVPDIVLDNGSPPTYISGFTQFKINRGTNGNAVVSTGSTSQLNTQKLVTDSGTDTFTTAVKGDIVALMNFFINDNTLNIFSSSTFNPFVARRIIHLLIIMTNYNIAVTYYNNAFTNTPEVINAIYKLFQVLNLNVTDVQNGSFSQIVNAVQGRANTYNSNQIQITSLDSDVSTLKDNIATDRNNLQARLGYQAKVKIYQTAAIAMLIVISIGALCLFVLPLEYKQKITGGGTLIIIAVLTSIILQYQNSKTLLKEGFAGFSDNSGMDSLRTLAGDATAATAIAGYNKQMGNECITYLNNTFVLVSSLDSYHLYGNITYAQSKELRAFGDTKTSLTMADTNLKDVYNISYMEQVRFSALMNLAISLSLIIAVTVTLILPLENYPYVRKVILIIGGLFALISITLYILETTTRVHTKPKQIYWSAADTKQLESTS